ncbi:ABI3 protein, partial [Pycnonotus jocosus]|nr:ABI3 protein [Pycnonotus jocosus]
IPEGRRLLREQHGNLLRVAEYCHGHYLQAGDKRKALEQTMALSTQALASVTCQVSGLASAFLRLLELQAAQLRQVEADITCLAQRVAIHTEKVSRRGIGALTAPRSLLSPQRVTAPPEPPVLEPYYRKPLDFSALDHVGHGVKDSSTQLSRTGTLARRSTKGCSAPPVGTMGRSSRVPEPVRPPVVPQGKLPVAPGSPTVTPPLLHPSSSGAAPGDGIPAPPPLPGPPVLALSPPGPPVVTPSPPGPPPPTAAILPPPPLPGDLLPPLPGDLALPPGDLPPPALPDLGDMALPPPPALPGFGDTALPPPPALPDLGDTALPPPPATEEPPWAPERYLEK